MKRTAWLSLLRLSVQRGHTLRWKKHQRPDHYHPPTDHRCSRRKKTRLPMKSVACLHWLVHIRLDVPVESRQLNLLLLIDDGIHLILVGLPDTVLALNERVNSQVLAVLRKIYCRLWRASPRLHSRMQSKGFPWRRVVGRGCVWGRAVESVNAPFHASRIGAKISFVDWVSAETSGIMGRDGGHYQSSIPHESD